MACGTSAATSTAFSPGPTGAGEVGVTGAGVPAPEGIHMCAAVAAIIHTAVEYSLQQRTQRRERESRWVGLRMSASNLAKFNICLLNKEQLRQCSHLTQSGDSSNNRSVRMYVVRIALRSTTIFTVGMQPLEHRPILPRSYCCSRSVV